MVILYECWHHICMKIDKKLPKVFHNESSARVSAILPSSCHAPLRYTSSLPEIPCSIMVIYLWDGRLNESIIINLIVGYLSNVFSPK